MSNRRSNRQDPTVVVFHHERPENGDVANIAATSVMAHSLENLLDKGRSELITRGDELRAQRTTLIERRAHVQFALNAIDGQIGIIDRALQLIEAN